MKLRGGLDFIASFCGRWPRFLAFLCQREAKKKKKTSGTGHSDAVGLFRRLIPSAGWIDEISRYSQQTPNFV